MSRGDRFLRAARQAAKQRALGATPQGRYRTAQRLAWFATRWGKHTPSTPHRDMHEAVGLVRTIDRGGVRFPDSCYRSLVPLASCARLAHRLADAGFDFAVVVAR